MGIEAQCRLVGIEGLPPSSRRGTVFVEMTDNRVNVSTAYAALREKDRSVLRARIEHWQGGGVRKEYHHGWDKSEFQGRYTECYVFKVRGKGGVDQRFYGYIHHPKPSDRRFELCVLIRHSEKTQWKTEEANLRAVLEIGASDEVVCALAHRFGPRH